MRVIILGAAGQISRMLTEILLRETDHELVLVARNAHRRLTAHPRVTLVDGSFGDPAVLEDAFAGGADIVYNNSNTAWDEIDSVIEAMKSHNIGHIVQASAGGAHQELPPVFQEWNNQAVSRSLMDSIGRLNDKVEASGLTYTIMRYLWLYNEDSNEDYVLTQKSETFIGTQVSRQACARLTARIIESPSDYANQSLGIGEPGTDGDRPVFYR